MLDLSPSLTNKWLLSDLLEWRQAHVNIEMSWSFTLVIEAVRGKSFDGIMAIDDIKFSGDLTNAFHKANEDTDTDL